METIQMNNNNCTTMKFIELINHGFVIVLEYF